MRCVTKVSIIGSGFVGSACAEQILNRTLCDEVVLLDIEEGMACGKALDLLQSSALSSKSTHIIGTTDYKDIQSSDIVIITAGQARRPGMSRDELQKTNANIIRSICQKIKQYADSSYVIVVTNPLDVMTYVAYKSLGFPAHQIMGMAGVLDSARFRTFVSEELKINPCDIQAFVLGGHGDTMVFLPRLCHVGGIPLTELLPPDRIHALVNRAKNGGAEIVSLLKTGSAYYAPAKSVVEMATAILKDQKRILPVSAFLNGEYGVQQLFMGVLCLIGANGVEKVMEFQMTEAEKKEFQSSVSAVKAQVEKL